MRNSFGSDTAAKGIIGFAFFIWLIYVGIVLSILGVIAWVLYTIITKPEVLAHWIKVVTG